MKKLQTETSTTGRAPANVHDQSGVLLGTATADWDAYRLWASGPSDTVEAGRVLSAEDIARLGLADDSSVFLLDAPEVELARQQPDCALKQLTTNDWNGRPATFRVGSRVLLHNDDGTLHQGTVTALLSGSDTDGSCEIAFDDGQAGSEGCWSLEVLN